MRQAPSVLFVLLAALRLCPQAAATCPKLQRFSTTFLPKCEGNEVNVKWPNHENQNKYYMCINYNQALLMSCPAGEYFIYSTQMCGPCDAYVAPPACSLLPTEREPTCAIVSLTDDDNFEDADVEEGEEFEDGDEQTSTTATPVYPTAHTPSTSSTDIPTPFYPPSTTPTTTTSTTTTTTTTTPPTTRTTTVLTTTPTQPPTTVPPTTTPYDGPPTPGSGSSSDMPLPPTAAPTPPVVVVTPPEVSSL